MLTHSLVLTLEQQLDMLGAGQVNGAREKGVENSLLSGAGIF